MVCHSEPLGRMVLVPTSIADAKGFVEVHHRHLPAPAGAIFALGVADEHGVRGVAMVGRPIARLLQDEWTAEVLRVATDGRKHACSMLYGAAWRACRAMGYRRLVTYTLVTEPGTSLRASGWALVGAAGGGTWSRSERPRVDRHPLQGKLRWERTEAL